MADILSQDEVDLLLNAVTDGGGPLDEETTEAAPVPEVEQHLTVYDFRRPERISKEQLRGLQSLFEAFARELSVLMPGYLRTVTRVDLTSIDQLTYDEFILSVGRPTSLNIVRLSPLEGTAILEFSPSLVFPIVDRLLGGVGQPVSDLRELTEIEQRILQRIIFMVLDSLTRAWSQLVDFKLKLIGQENDPLIVQIVPGSEMVILIGFEIHIGEISGTMNLCIPLVVLNPILDRISAQSQFVPTLASDDKDTTKGKIIEMLDRATLPVSAFLGSTTISVRDLMSIKPGDIIQLDQSTSGSVQVNVGSRPKYKGKQGKIGKKLAVQVFEYLESEPQREG